MAEERVQRRLAAIMAADVVGYSRLMGEDEVGTRAQFNANLNELIEPALTQRIEQPLPYCRGLCCDRANRIGARRAESVS